MFYYLNGTVAVIDNYLAVIDCGGVGFSCNTSLRSLSTLEIGKKVKMYTSCVIREDAFDIYGFTTQAELNSFKMLTGISGVGPKAALSILSSSSPEDLALAVANGNEKALTIAPGIGKKLAQRILLELKDKVSADMRSLTPGNAGVSAGQTAVGDQKSRDVAAALSVLGYNPSEINAVLSKIDITNLSVEEAIRQALKSSLR
jgi:Holliday junction DNA helicase RuvA